MVERFLNNEFAAKAVQEVIYDNAVKYYLVVRPLPPFKDQEFPDMYHSKTTTIYF